MELVKQLLPQPSQAAPQPVRGEESPAPPPLEASQAAGTSGTVVRLPSPSWLHTGDLEGTPGALQPLSPSHAGQHPVLHHGNPLPAVLGLTARQGVAMEASPHQLWPFPASPVVPVPLATNGLSMAQVPASLRGKIQWGEYVDLSELLAYNFQYQYSGLDESQALEVVDGKLYLAPKHRARHLSNLQLWLHAWHLYEDTVLSFFPHRYMELSHYWQHILDLDQHFHWAAVLSYDAQFQHKCAVHGLPFSTFDQQLYVTPLDTTAAKTTVSRCFWCQHFNHEVIDCPFPLGAPLEKDLVAKKAAQSQQGQGTYHQQQQCSSTKSAFSISQAPAASPTAEGPMCAGTVSRTTLLQHVILQAQSSLNLDSFQCYLACHPDRQWSESLLWGICKGVDIGFQGKRKTVWSGNWKSAVDNGSVVSNYLTAEVALRRKAGPFNQPLFSKYVGSPMGIVIKKCLDSVKYCIIHDLSWPPRDSVNDHIVPDLYCCIYASFDQAVSLIKKQGVGTLMAKLDLADAFKHILVCPKDWLLLCSSWDTPQADGLVLWQYYIDLFLPFGLCSSPAIFNHYAKSLEFAMWANGIKDLLHYLNNYFTAGPAGTGECQHNIGTMVQVCRDLGFVVNPSKVTSPSPVTSFLGIDIDSHQGVARIDPKHLQAIKQKLSGFHWAKSATK